MDTPQKKTGFAVIVGRSNTGKSTLLNALVGTKLAIISQKPQTTRTAIRGILNDERGQVVFVDTPGIFHKPNDLVTERLNATVAASLKEIDLVLYLVDPTKAIGNEEHSLQRLLEAVPKEKKILVINKTDNAERPFEHEYERMSDQFLAVVRISALEERNIKELKNVVFENLPVGEAYYPEFQVATMENAEWIGEIVREKAFQYLQDELPYSVSVRVDEFGEKKDVFMVKATILTTNDRYKGIIIGKNALKIKEIGTAARKELEVAMNRKVFLDLQVDVDEHWPDRFFSNQI